MADKLWSVKCTGVRNDGQYIFRVISPFGTPTDYIKVQKSPIPPNSLLEICAEKNSKLILDKQIP